MKYKFLSSMLTILLALQAPLNLYAESKESTEASADFYDYIIVGVGSAGSILARKLSDPKSGSFERSASVLAIDIGEFRYDDPIINTSDWISVANILTFDPRYAKTYVFPTAPIGQLLQALGYSEGSGSIGGGGAHNFLLAVRGTPGLYDSWAATSFDSRWLYNSLLPKMKALETFYPNATPFDPTQRGFDGPIDITQKPPVNGSPYYQSLQNHSGSFLSDDYNNPRFPLAHPLEGHLGLVIGADQETVTPPPNSQRSYSAKEFLPMSGPNAVIDAHGNGLHGRKLKVLTNARALHFKVENNRAVSVDYVRTFGFKDIAATACLKDNGKLILTAGSVQTPKILMQSGIGPAAKLNALDIPVVVNSPHVGQNAINHFGTTALIFTGTTQVPPGQAFINGTPYQLITPTNPNQRRIQLTHSGTFPNPFGPPGTFVMQVFVFIIDPNSRGSTEIVSKNPLIDPIFTPNMYDPLTGQNVLMQGTDANLIVAGLKVLRDAATDPAVNFVMIQPSSATYLAGDDALFEYATSLDNWIIESHNVGTARMGTDISNGVVNGRLRVFGLDNVYIGDASVQPRIIDGNTNLGVYYTAQELASILGFPTPPAL